MNGVSIPIHKKIKIIDVWFDSKNTWIPHLKSIRKDSLIRINTLKSLAHNSWGSHSSSLIQIYKALILSKLEYNSFLFIKAKASAIKMIDTVHNIGLRLTTGAFRSSPIPSILNIAGVAPLNIRRTHSLMLLATRRTQNNLKIMNPINNILANIRYPYLEINKNEILLAPPWTANTFTNVTLSELPKKDTIPIIYKQQLQSIISKLYNFTEVYTDGSKMDNGVGAAIVFKDHEIMLSIYTAEAVAILYALDVIKKSNIFKALILTQHADEHWQQFRPK